MRKRPYYGNPKPWGDGPICNMRLSLSEEQQTKLVQLAESHELNKNQMIRRLIESAWSKYAKGVANGIT